VLKKETVLPKVYPTKSTCGFAVFSTHLDEDGLADGNEYFAGDWLPDEMLVGDMDRKKRWNVKITIEAEEVK
jgi:hypothetical protein